ncbi:MAG: carboxypeptidase-like regulatory domain-containing protein [Candidatus Solibacter sp.]|nr:carboxypeptidase-like regulatory domain-containing protein [Candidatus Solibacter sp.]
MNTLLRTALLLALITACAMGQAARTGTLVGTVTDSSGAVIPAAQVTVKNVDTAFVSKGETNAEGGYYIPFLAVGSYELKVEAAGFKAFVQTGIQLRAAEVPRIDVRLDVGAATESVQVTGGAPLLETETSQVSQTVEHQTIEQLPIMQMKAQRLLYYVEGLQIRGADASVVGQASSALGFTLDGVSAKTSVRDGIGDTNTSVQPALDALAEAKVYTTGAPAEIGHASGGMLSMTFRSGANDLHGSLEDRWTNAPLTHRGYLEQGKRTNPITFHQGQATFSGPVVIPKLYNGRNRTFFLFAYGRHHEKTDEPQTATVPDANMLNGDFSFPQASGGGYPIYDPKSMRQVNGTWTADIFPNFAIPKSRFDPVATNFLALNPWSAANNPGGATYSRTGPTNNYLGYTIYRAYRSRYDSKIDQQINSKNKFFARNSWNRHRQLGRISAGRTRSTSRTGPLPITTRLARCCSTKCGLASRVASPK